MIVPLFTHAPLPRPSSYRLVEVLPAGNPDDVVSVTVHIHDLAPLDGNNTPPQYTALSYTWGTPEETVPIEINGHPFQVTCGLHRALRQLRQSLSPLQRESVPPAGSTTNGEGHDPEPIDTDLLPSRFVWVDALCINQDDAAEKNAQVARMSAIFSGAHCIYGWLGPATDTSHLAFARIRLILNRYHTITSTYDLESIPRWAANMLADEFMLCEDEVDDVATWTAVQDFFDRDWWTRVWIAQEATTDVPTLLAVGAETMRLEDVLTFAVLLAMNEKDDEDAASRIYPISPFVYTLQDVRSKRAAAAAELVDHTNGPETELLSTLMTCRYYDATDPRDKVYGILGMASPRNAIRLLPDYSKDLMGVYTDVVQYHIGTSPYEGKLDFLGADGLPEGGLSGLPSWLPDWRFRDQYQVPFRKFFDDEGASTPRPGRNRSGPTVYHASGTTSSVRELGVDPSSTATIDGRQLKLKGYLVGFLYDIQPVFEPGSQHDETLTTWRNSLTNDAPYFTGETEYEALQRLLVADILDDGNSAPCRTPADEVHNPPFPPTQSPTNELLLACTGRRLARVVNRAWNADALALVPQSVREGDQVFVLLGGQVLYVLRGGASSDGAGPVSGNGVFRFVGECYVHGLMDGEVLDLVGSGVTSVRDVVIR